MAGTGDMNADAIELADDGGGEADALAATEGDGDTATPTADTPPSLKTRRGAYKRPTLSIAKKRDVGTRNAKRAQAEAQEAAAGAALLAVDDLMKDVNQALAAAELEEHVGDAALQEVAQMVETLQALPQTAMQPRRKAAMNKALESKTTQLNTAAEAIRTKLGTSACPPRSGRDWTETHTLQTAAT